MFKRQEASGLAAAGAMLAAFSIGQAVQASNGAGSPDAYRYLGMTLALLLGALFFGRRGGQGPAWAGTAMLVVGAACFIWQARQLLSGPPAVYLRGASMFDFLSRAAVFAVLAGSAVGEKPLFGRWHVPLAVLAFVWTGAWILQFSPQPIIDVFSMTNEALVQLKRGLSPYDMKFRNIYHHTLWYGGNADNDWVYAGYPYPPMSLLLSLVGSWFGDIRWANLAALAVAPLAFLGGRGRFAALAGVLYLATPRVFFVLEQTWTDVFLIGLFALSLWCAARLPKLTPFVLAVAISTKQYMIFLLPLVPLLFDEKWSRREALIFLGKLAATGLLINLPFFLMAPGAFIKSMTNSDFVFRTEALSFLAATAENGHPIWPVWLQLPLMLPVMALAWWRGPRGPAGFALASAAVICTFFAFSKHAFCNHHFLTLGLACTALAFFGVETAPPPASGKA